MQDSQQSPVGISEYTRGGAPRLEFAYDGAAARIINTGEFVKVIYEDAGGILVDGRNYRIIEMHAHNPSEHIVDGKRFALEAHLVHTRASGEIAVVGVLFRLGEANPAIQAIIDNAPAQGEADAKPPAPLTPDDYLPTDGGYYAYTGSLTTPPYTEGVQWLVQSEPMEISDEQVRQLAALTGGGTNSRPVQPLNDRRITAHNTP